MATMSANHFAVERIAQNNKLTEAEKIGEVAEQFEAILATKPMLSQNEGMNPAQKSIYQDMITNTLADTMSQSGEFGLAQAFRRQLLLRGLGSGEMISEPKVQANE